MPSPATSRVQPVRRRLRIAWLPDGKRLRLQDGPMDLVLQGFGRRGDIARAYDAAIARMRVIYDELYEEIAALGSPALADLHGQAARRMEEAVAPFRPKHFITPMAAVAGAVADDVLAIMCAAAPLERAFVNNSGDIAIFLSPGHSFLGNVLDRQDRPRLTGKMQIDAASSTRGIATSGWAGRGFSLGIADAVTVAASTAAAADAAATIIANATDLPDHPAVMRLAANTLDPDTDLKDMLVTVDVGTLTAVEKARALEAGKRAAAACLEAGLINGAAIYVQGEAAFVRPAKSRGELEA